MDRPKWPEPMVAIYRKALNDLNGNEMPLLYGPAHVVWADGNWDQAEWCLQVMNQQAASAEFSASELAVVRQSLEEVLALPESDRQM